MSPFFNKESDVSSKNKPFKICNEIVHPGEHLTLALPLPEIYSCAPLHMPIKIAHGRLEGPCLLIIAAMHGNELNGTEIINRIFAYKGLGRLRGTVIMVPVMNVYGLLTRSRFLPGEIELDRSFPGSKIGNLASRMAHMFVKEIFSKADICIDLQTGGLNSSNLPQVYINKLDTEAEKLARLFNAPVISFGRAEKGRLRTYALKQSKPHLLYEAGEALRFDEYAIKVGLRGILNIMQGIGMLPNKKKNEDQLSSFIAEKNIWIRAATSGISHPNHKLGARVNRGETLCVIKDPFDTTSPVSVTSPEDAIIVGMNNLPLVHEGERLFQLATFPKMTQVASELEDWQHEEV